ncbi:exopolygalacturonase-like [Corylus avellana]|uniref:exopolygalacturonase-like n=1 Tax=Corylus avellana TaxID=13451 RepID=UPI00286D33C5|nr:exopolygalacturonase-like [Corylus avellana]
MGPTLHDLSNSRQQTTGPDSLDGVPVNIRLDYVTNSIVRDISSYNSKQFHIHALGCQNLTFDHVTIKAPQNSPNTDGIHIGRSTKINVINSQISIGDDCVSIGDGSRDMLIQGVNCGPGHGISIGSLGMYQNEQPVSRVRVIGCNLTNTSNGVRIKTWPDSYPRSAADFLFENIIINNVDTPIIVDQGYCPWNVCKPEIPSKVKISNVSFKNLRGTSARKSAVVLVCSSSLPCENVELRDIDLRYNGKDGPANSRCVNVNPIIAGYENPPPSLGTVRKIWLRRNDVVHGGVFVHPNVLKKVNWDASIAKKQGWMGFGVLVRDEKGIVITAECKTLLGCRDPSVAEARAALMAIYMCKDLRLRQVHLERDTQVVVSAVNCSMTDWSRMELLVGDIKRELRSVFSPMADDLCWKGRQPCGTYTIQSSNDECYGSTMAC